jgi:Fe-Mn family superoxide dismutase
MWEHAYYLQYQNEKAKWVKAFWEIVDWSNVAERWQGASKVDLRLGKAA